MPNFVNNTTYPNPLDLIAPHICRGCGAIGEPICARCKSYIASNYTNICPVCKTANPTGVCKHCQKDPTTAPLPPTYSIGERSDLLAAIVHDYKYHSIRALARPLAELLSNVIPTPTKTTYIVPLPTISRHIRERALDHTFFIAKNLAKLHPNYHPTRLLTRINNTVQVGSNAHDRVTQARSAYALNPKITIDHHATYMLLDDVWTTGASLRAATDILRSAGINDIMLAILAVSRV